MQNTHVGFSFSPVFLTVLYKAENTNNVEGDFIIISWLTPKFTRKEFRGIAGYQGIPYRTSTVSYPCLSFPLHFLAFPFSLLCWHNECNKYKLVSNAKYIPFHMAESLGNSNWSGLPCPVVHWLAHDALNSFFE